MLNLILEDLTFNEKFKTFFTDEKFEPEDGKVYQTIGIIGCQSSGKEMGKEKNIIWKINFIKSCFWNKF